MAINKYKVTKGADLLGTFETGSSVDEFKEEFFPDDEVTIERVGGDVLPTKEVADTVAETQTAAEPQTAAETQTAVDE